MNVNELILKLTKLQQQGKGELKVKLDFGACEIKSAIVENELGTDKEYIHLDWIEE